MRRYFERIKKKLGLFLFIQLTRIARNSNKKLLVDLEILSVYKYPFNFSNISKFKTLCICVEKYLNFSNR